MMADESGLGLLNPIWALEEIENENIKTNKINILFCHKGVKKCFMVSQF
jgi:hypothetical protein